jgi:hypothetical protein
VAARWSDESVNWHVTSDDKQTHTQILCGVLITTLRTFSKSEPGIVAGFDL